MNEIHNQREIEHLQSEIARLEADMRRAALDWLAAAEQYVNEIARLRAALKEIRDAGPMTLDDQRWRIALAALGGKND